MSELRAQLREWRDAVQKAAPAVVEQGVGRIVSW